MRLIGAGLPRTATLTQKIALEMLGLAPCHHMVEVFGNLSQAARWREAFDGTLSPAELLKDHQAMVDWPGSYYYTELLESFPEAKVLLSVRDGDAWARSMRETIWECLYGDGVVAHMNAARCAVDSPWGGWMDTLKDMWQVRGLLNGTETTDEWMADAMRRYNDEVKETVPADRLLVWTPADGWEPLCEFLELPVPDAPFPHINDTKAFGENIIDGALEAVRQYRAAGETVAA